MEHPMHTRIKLLLAALVVLAGCAGGRKYQDAKMDFGAVRTVAVMPFGNLTTASTAGERVRDVFSNMLLATGAVYVLPSGEVTRAVGRNGITTPATPSKEDVIAMGKLLNADAVITGVLKEYGEVRSGSTSANAISVSTQTIETQTGKVVWSASSTKGGVGFWDRLLGGGGEAMNQVTEDAVRDLLSKLFH
jgi:polysaccharide biosynthesis protein PelC